jgi:uncharacterized protein
MSKLVDWIKAQAPSRESFEGNRFLRPFAKRIFVPELWRFTRRSVPRGVALGLLVGLFLLIPGVQIVGAALLALPVRANIPIAAAMTFLSMPATTPFILAGSVYIGNAMFKLHADVAQFKLLFDEGASLYTWMAWIVSMSLPPGFGAGCWCGNGIVGRGGIVVVQVFHERRWPIHPRRESKCDRTAYVAPRWIGRFAFRCPSLLGGE